MSTNPIYFAPYQVPITDARSGLISREWYLFLQALFNRVGGTSAASNEDLATLLLDDSLTDLGDLPTAQQLGFALYGQTAAERVAGVTPVNYVYPSGNVLRHGADPTGAVDSTAAIQAALDTAPGQVTAVGTFKITATLNIKRSNVTLVGYGGGDTHDAGSGDLAASQLVWAGAAGAAMVAVYSPAGATLDNQTGMGVSGLQLNCNSVAGYGLLVTSVRKCLFDDVYVANPTIAAFKVTTLQNGQLAVTTDAQHNVFNRLSWRCLDSTAAKAAHGIYLTSFNPTPGTNGNASLNDFYDCYGENDGTAAGVGLLIEDGDNNNFFNFTAYRAATTIAGIQILGYPSCDSNHFFRFQSGAANGIVIQGTVSGFPTNPVRNCFFCGDTQNGQLYPVLDAGCRVYWLDSFGEMQLPILLNAVLGQSTSASSARAQVANVTNESLRILNGSANHVVITDGTSTWGLNLDGSGNLRFNRTAGSGIVTVLQQMKSTGAITANYASAIPAGGAATGGLLVSSTAAFGVFFGSGAPTLSAAQGSLYMRSDGSSTSTRLYVNTDGSTGWTNAVTAT